LQQRQRGTFSQDVLAQLREAIVMGQIAPGAPLRLEELAALLGVSVSPIREALRQLEIIGLAEHSPFRGTRVSLLTMEEMQETYEIRGALEGLAVRRAATRFADEDVESAELALAELAEGYAVGDRSRVIRGNTTFHLSIARAARSAGLLRLIAAACETSERYSASVLSAGDPADTQEIERAGHLAIYEACVEHDVEKAAAVLGAHLDVFARLFSGHSLPPQPAAA
jgi:DNA-binding GntR family transcriptional regulator